MSDRARLPARPGKELHTWHLGALTSDARVRDDARYEVLAREGEELEWVIAGTGCRCP